MFVSGPIFELEPGKFAHFQGAFLVTFDLDCEFKCMFIVVEEAMCPDWNSVQLQR
jgi:hypothetical protein